MADDAHEFRIPPERRAACAVYAVAIGDHLGFDLEALKRLRAAVEGSTLTGDAALDEVLLFVAGGVGDSRLTAAYEAVAPLIQPANWEPSHRYPEPK
jgi:hypothetical protein